MWRPLALITIGLLTTGCDGGCTDTAVLSEVDPGGKLKAVLFERDCGATTSFGTQISVLPKDKALAHVGNVMVADDNHGAARGGSWGGPWADVKWISPTHLVVRYARASRIFRKTDHVGSVQITFEAHDP